MQAHGAFLEMLLAGADREDDQPFGSSRSRHATAATGRAGPGASPDPAAALEQALHRRRRAALGGRDRTREQPRIRARPPGEEPMSLATVWVSSPRSGTSAPSIDRYGRISEASRSASRAELPDEFKVTIAHTDQEVGELGHIELGHDGLLHAVAVVDDKIASWDGDLFWSTAARNPGRCLVAGAISTASTYVVLAPRGTAFQANRMRAWPQSARLCR